jgi:2-dehydropantoate 2-reductase
MKIGFVGCGAIGSCYASYLSREHEVCVLDTYAPVIESIKKNGILVDECVPGTGTGETVVFHPAMATTDPKEIGVVDLLIVFVHYQYLEAAVRNALPMIDKHTMVLCRTALATTMRSPRSCPKSRSSSATRRSAPRPSAPATLSTPVPV